MSQKTVEVLAHHINSLGSGNVDAIMEDYTDESVMFTPDGVLVGAAAIRPFFEKIVKDLLPAGSSFNVARQDVHGETAYILWTADSINVRFHLGTDTIVVRDGKIAIHTFGAAIQQK